MPIRRDAEEEFPFEAVRDLLGLVRAMYAAARDRRAGRGELAKIASVGKDLAEALELARDCRVGTIGERAAWTRAEAATRRAGELVDAFATVEPLMTAATQRVSGTKAMKRKAPFDR